MSKNLVFGERAKLVTMRLYSWEKLLVKAYIKTIRAKKKKELEKESKNGIRGQNISSKS